MESLRLLVGVFFGLRGIRTFGDRPFLAGVLCHGSSAGDVLLVQTAHLQLLGAVAKVARSGCHEGSTLCNLSLHVMAWMSVDIGCKNRCGNEGSDELHVGVGELGSDWK